MSSALTTDLYHQDAAYVAWRTGRTGPATFDLYIRHAPFGGAYVLTAGLAAALAHATGFRYTDEDLRYLAQIRAYDPAFLDYLRALRFTGDVAAMPEGTIAFPSRAAAARAGAVRRGAPAGSGPDPERSISPRSSPPKPPASSPRPPGGRSRSSRCAAPMRPTQ